MGNRFTPKGTKYNEEDPLGILAQEAEIQKKIDFPNPIQRFIESEALKKDKARMFRINRPSRYELELDFEDILKKLMGMVVTFETRKGYIRGRIDRIWNGCVRAVQRGTKKEYWVDFDEVLSLKRNYS